jgi:hypothetical protein
MTDSFSNANGDIIPPTDYGMSDDFPLEVLITMTLEDLGGKTKLTLKQVGIPAGEMSEMTTAGWQGSFDKLAASLR